MTVIRMGCIQTGTPLGVVGGAIPSQGLSDSLTGGNYKKPPVASGLPRLSDALDYKNSTVDTTGLTNVSAYDWRIVGGATISTSATIQREFTLGATLNQLAETTVTLSEAIPVGTPASGFIIIFRDAGAAEPVSRIAYSSWSGSTLTLTTATRFSNSSGDTVIRTATAGNFVGIVQHSGQWIECRVTADPASTVYTSPPIKVYASAHMDMFDYTHGQDEEALLRAVKHTDATHIQMSDGNWSNPAIWNTGTVPKSGAAALVPYGRNLVYDNQEPNVRLDTLRIEGSVTIPVTENTHTKLLAETVVVPQNGTLTIGTSRLDYMPESSSFEMTISGKDYSADSFVLTDIKASTFSETRGWGRGLLVLGNFFAYGYPKWSHGKATAGLSAGATSLTLQDTPYGLEIGDQIVIGATTSNYDQDNRGVFGTQDEYREVSLIDGNTIHWVTPLVYPHDNQCPTSSREDIYPVIVVLDNKNVTFRSEPGAEGDTLNSHRRGHTAFMHHMANVYVEHANFHELGRTNKAKGAGVINAAGQFRVYYETGTLVEEALTPQSNLQSRYGIHFHHNGYMHDYGEVPRIYECCINGSPGWAAVHHSGAARLDECVVHAFFASGIVSEQADEIDTWFGNVAIHCTHDNVSDLPGSQTLASGVKNLETLQGIYGDPAKYGSGFFFRGRGMVTNRNIAVSCPVGHEFFHRGYFAGQDPNIIMPVKHTPRAVLDVGNLGLIRNSSNPTGMTPDEVPILHFDQNEAYACYRGGFISKGGPGQDHDLNIRLLNFKAVGCNIGFEPEYIGVYVFDGFDIIGGANPGGVIAPPGIGLSTGGNIFQFAITNSRIEGYPTGVYTANSISSEAGDPTGTAAIWDGFTQDDPRWMLIGIDFKDVTTQYTTDGFLPSARAINMTAADVTRTEDDPYDTFLDPTAQPSDTFPDVIGTFDGNGNSSYTSAPADNEMGVKQSILGDQKIAPKAWGDTGIPATNIEVGGYALNAGQGYWDDAGTNRIVFVDLISDPITGRPALRTRKITTTTTAGLILRGNLNYSATPVTCPDKLVTVGKNGSLVIDALVGAAGGNGTFNVYPDIRLKPNSGHLLVDGDSLTYIPHEDYTGTDHFFVFVESGWQFDTVRVDILVGGDIATLDAPVSGTHFVVADGGAQTINVTLNTPPDMGRRKVRRVEYTTDGGSTWRRMCNFWPVDVHTISLTSAGVSITAGSYNIQIRYKTDLDRSIVASSAVSVTVA